MEPIISSAGRSLRPCASRVEYRPQTTLWHLDPDGTLYLECGGHTEILTSSRVLLATGAYEWPVPIPGWTLPGVMGAGAAQILLKSGDLGLECRVVLAGQGALLYFLATARAPAPHRWLCSKRRRLRTISQRRGTSEACGRAVVCC